MKDKIAIIGHVEPGSVAAAALKKLEETGVEVVNLESQMKEETYVLKNRQPIPIYPFGMSEKKKSKPCEQHEYTKRANGKWLCRHCERDIKAE